MIKRIIDYFIPLAKRNEDGDMRGERIFVTVVLISTIFCLFGISTAIEIQLHLVAYILLFNALFNVVILFAYRNAVSKNIAGHFFLAQFQLAFMAQAWLQGGVISPATAAFFLLPAIAMLIFGKRGAFIWIGISCLVIVALYFIEIQMGAPEIIYPQNKQTELFFSAVLTTNICIFLILLVYENNKNNAIKELDKQHKDLVAAQSQLIQTEKMASLGELTAGIAHEIQNPLNFVNNFAELNDEILVELQLALETGNMDEAAYLSKAIKDNSQKINHHGKRADSIVKGMLQHSRVGSGQKEPTDINALCNEYIRLAYHGMRAKDKDFNARIETRFDEHIGKLNVVPQDFSRALLNMINNAFYAVNQKQKKNIAGYEPEVTISTTKEKEAVKISIADNGDGIPESIKDKIFQPFFTTKPTGQGTGLGLSLAYEIIQAHGARLMVDSQEGVGTRFIINMNKNSI